MRTTKSFHKKKKTKMIQIQLLFLLNHFYRVHVIYIKRCRQHARSRIIHIPSLRCNRDFRYHVICKLSKNNNNNNV